MVWAAWARTDGHFCYPLDDAYIHLALAEHIARGHYGINVGESVSPSSSLLWPVLLTPFAGTVVHRLVPLGLNGIFGSAAAGVLGTTVGRWLPGLRMWWQLLMAGLLVFAANLVGLTVLGMEHVLQVLLAIGCALGMAEVLAGRRVPWWAIAAAMVAPSVRYEDLGLSVALSLALVGMGRGVMALLTLVGAALPLVGFAAWLHARGLPGLPLSVLVKANAFAGGTGHERLVRLVRFNLEEDAFHWVVRAPTLGLTGYFLYLALTATTRARRFVYGGALTLGLLQLTIGRFGWFHRYEVYAVIFLVLVCLKVLAEGPRPRVCWILLLLIGTAPLYVKAALVTPEGARAVYLQQGQMHRFQAEFYRGNFAVNDLGLAAFDRPPGTYLLDLGGLASEQAARHRDAAWIAAAATAHGADLAMVYPEYVQVPRAWRLLATLCEHPRVTVILGEPCVNFYSTRQAADGLIASELKRFAPTLPQGATMTFSAGAGEAMPGRETSRARGW